ncbi:MAG TPA: hypothetical protein DD435_02550 [Cyanobacteria bacterium UBA8530]|nr:hypothetical protein [Cyanobacteria bacterium UBA8530]
MCDSGEKKGGRLSDEKFRLSGSAGEDGTISGKGLCSEESRLFGSAEGDGGMGKGPIRDFPSTRSPKPKKIEKTPHACRKPVEMRFSNMPSSSEND